ncbi:Detected protein of unknown function [Hibiscus syriacus]|uniref:Uncharacterized protein n=1 Tax=Hibiscus syriacus TaxID=106335 RepID=A0A6A2WET3_HIBSY|nr:Detected protein of unknown function [Hibiscus syriacus]
METIGDGMKLDKGDERAGEHGVCSECSEPGDLLYGGVNGDTCLSNSPPVSSLVPGTTVRICPADSTEHLDQPRPTPCTDISKPCEAANTGQKAILCTGLYLVALGTSGVKAALPLLGADQFDGKDLKEAVQLSSYFNWDNAPKGSPIIRILQVLVASIRKRSIPIPGKEDELCEINGKGTVVVRVLQRTNQFRITGVPTGIRHLQRIGVELELSTISMAISAVIETSWAATLLPCGELSRYERNQHSCPLVFSSSWLLYKLSCGGGGEQSQRGLVASNNLNRQVKLFLLVIITLSTLNFLIYLVCASWHKYKNVEEMKQEEILFMVMLIRSKRQLKDYTDSNK